MFRMPRMLAAAALAAALIGPGIDPASAQQNLTVRPMKVEADIPANRTSRVTLRVQNHHATQAETLRLEVVDLAQRKDGRLSIVDGTRRETLGELARQASSRDWIELPSDTVVVEPETVAEIPALLRVPPDARGAYVSAIRVLTEAPPTPERGEEQDQQGFFAVSFGFLIPLLTEIEGRPVRQDVGLSDVSMRFDDGRDADGNEIGEPTTRVAFAIDNRGRTHSSVQGDLRVERRVGDSWRLVTRTELARRNVLPGASLELARDLERRLPSGEYRLVGEIAVDGRREPRLVKEIDFEGDPDTDSVAYDTALRLEPASIDLGVVPGATRAETVAVTNPADRPVTVEAAVRTPEALRGVAMGDLMGDQLSAAPWVQMRPERFTIRPDGQRTIRVMSRVPREGVEQANYYADIVLEGRYADGQSAGQTRSMLRLQHEAVEPVVEASIGRIGVALGDEPSSAVVQSRLTNTGSVHLEPAAGVELISGTGRIVVRSDLVGEAGVLLPLGVRDLGGTLDLSSVEPGEYTLRITSYQGGTRIAQESVAVHIGDVADGGERELMVTGGSGAAARAE
ncbi:hypothetical protein LRF89_03175 [Halorhodospira sp. 9621]|uniref:hypothetical protein n=1 Tax=Halorhodospira sp. 9621 TaxID=2899135 RepID=UPI001EE8A4CF|nr:hypothetical protein [Halorhodospira sp. 9621]MCG5532439.1 hypothetical protein [Halorhodospira sp. 9621]